MAKVINKTEFETEVLNSNGVVIVDFFAEWCGPCKMLAPVLDELSAEMGDKVKVVKVDVDKDGELAIQYKVMGVPTMVFFKDGQDVDKIVGFVPKSALKEKLEYYNK